MGDYDREPASGSNKFLRLKSKDQSAVLRIASAPYREPKVWRVESRPNPKTGKEELVRAGTLKDDEVMRFGKDQWFDILGDPDYEVDEVYHWIVIDRTDGRAKVFQGTPGIYKSIKAYAVQPEWGDPQTYDLKITRTEAPGKNYYEVMALPNKPPRTAELTGREQAFVDALDIQQLLPNARPASRKQIDDVEDAEPPNEFGERVHEVSSPKTRKPKPDTVAEVTDEEPNLDNVAD